MGFESISPLPEDHAVDKGEVKTSQVVSCESTVIEKVEKSLSEEPFLLVLLENKDKESLGTICDLENIAEAITPRGDTLELSFSSEVLDDSLSLGCETPRESIFDPFAPGPDVAAWAPKKQVIRGAEVSSRRKLNFDSGDFLVKRLSFDWSDSEEEDEYLQVIQKMILDLFISDGPLDRQEESEKILMDSSLYKSCKTPDSKPLLTGIASTCPDAPLRPSHKVLKLSPGICRKIDFDAVSDSVSPRSSIDKENNPS
ncbi:hypothetical protein BAE44_0003091 [Dichanthelium oligosanthes]|uniref:Uncharacterized protein n=1 Tax=Dichanthelium oligosanthes TaxID=888268 RepID=A0A1E5WES4_9POAL|nr:hypothetical protein BAE44_0003091 [Dichanthelium oligosanthes]